MRMHHTVDHDCGLKSLSTTKRGNKTNILIGRINRS